MFSLPKADFERLLQAKILAFQDQFSSYFAGCLVVLSAHNSSLTIESPASQYKVLGENWTAICDAARLMLGCQVVKLLPQNDETAEDSEYTGQIKDSEADMNTSLMPGRVAIETTTEPTSQWANFDKTDSDGWISFESLSAAMGRDAKEIIRMVAKSRIPSFRHEETLAEGLNRQGVIQLLAAFSQNIYSQLEFQDISAPTSPSNQPEMNGNNGVAPASEVVTQTVVQDNATSAPAKEQPEEPLRVQLKLPADWTPKVNPQGDNYSRNPSPMTALNNALIALGIVAESEQYWTVIERLQRRRIGKEAKAFLQDVTRSYSDSAAAYTKLREQACRLWDKRVESLSVEA